MNATVNPAIQSLRSGLLAPHAQSSSRPTRVPANNATLFRFEPAFVRHNPRTHIAGQLAR